MHWGALGTTFVTLTALMDPVGVTPIFIATTAPLERGARRRAAVRAVLAAAFVAGAVLRLALGRDPEELNR